MHRSTDLKMTIVLQVLFLSVDWPKNSKFILQDSAQDDLSGGYRLSLNVAF